MARRHKRLGQSLTNFRMGELVTVEPFSAELPWNWKLMQENGIEGYHADHVHKGFEKPYPSSNVLPAVAEEAGSCRRSRRP